MAKKDPTDEPIKSESDAATTARGHERVTLKKPHTHRGQVHAVGDTIEVLSRQAQALRAAGKA